MQTKRSQHSSSSKLREDASSRAPFGTLLRRLRRAQQLTQRELSDLAGVTQSYISELESGKRLGVSRELVGVMVRALQLDEPNAAYLYEAAGYISPVGTDVSLADKGRGAAQDSALSDAEAIYRRLMAPSGSSKAKIRDLLSRLDSWDLLQQASVAVLTDRHLARYIYQLILTNDEESPLRIYLDELLNRLKQ